MLYSTLHDFSQITIKMKSIATILFLFSTCYNILLNNGVLGELEAGGIIGGRSTQPNEFPYVVSFQSNWDPSCGGGIIGEQHILTAAHCVISDEVTFRDFPHKIIAGVNDLSSSADTKVVVEVEKIYISERFNRSWWVLRDMPLDDIAVLKLKEKLDIASNEGLAVLDLPKKIAGNNNYDSYENATAMLAGFGYDYVQVITLPDGNVSDTGNSTWKLHQTKVLVINNSKCVAKYTVPIYDSQICAAVDGRSNTTIQGPCTGDSGSPLVIGNTVIGIMSTNAFGCNDNTAPSIYTRVSSHMDFIRNAINDDTKGMRVATAP